MSIHTEIPTASFPAGMPADISAAISDDVVESKAPVITVKKTSALVSRADLSAAVAACVRAVERRNTIPVLANMLLRYEPGGLAVVGTDLDMVMSAPLAGAVDPGFATTLPAHTLCDILKKAKASAMVAFDVESTVKEFSDGARQCDKETAILDFDGLRVTMNGIWSEDFPQMKVAPWSHSFALPTADLVRALSKTQFAISTEETRYYLNGVYMHIGRNRGADTLRFVATDGHRLAQCDVAVPADLMACSGVMPGVIIHRKVVAELLRLAKAKSAPDHVTVRVNATHTEFDFGTVKVLSKAIDGTFPDYGRVVPTGNDKRMTVNAADVLAGIEQVSVISSERGRAVKLSIEDSRLRLSVSNPDAGTAQMDITCEFASDSGPMDIGFNGRYLSDIIGNVESDSVTFMLADPGSPTLIYGEGEADAGVSYTLMPMRV